MQKIEQAQPILPPGFESDHEYNERAGAIYDEWSHKTLDDVSREFVDSNVYDNSVDSNRNIRYAVLGSPDADPEQVGVMSLPVGKVWNRETYIMASIVKEVTMPDGSLIVFPNNNLGQRAYTLDKQELHQLEGGDFSPISERQYEVVRALGVDSLRLVLGRSFGAALGASFASQAADHDIQLHATHFDEAPNTYDAGARGGFGLRWSVTREGGKLIPEYRSANLAAYDKASLAHNYLRFQGGLAKFLVGGNFMKPNAAINKAFLTPAFFDNVAGMLASNELATVSLSNASHSTVGDKDATAAFADAANTSMRGDIATYRLYGNDERKAWHATAVNPFVLGRLGHDALKWHKQVEVPGVDYGSIGEAEKAKTQQID